MAKCYKSTLWPIWSHSQGNGKIYATSYSHDLSPLDCIYCSPDASCLFTQTPCPNLVRMRQIKSDLVKSLHFPALVSSIKLSLLASLLRDVVKQMQRSRRRAQHQTAQHTPCDPPRWVRGGVPGLNENLFSGTFSYMHFFFFKNWYHKVRQKPQNVNIWSICRKKIKAIILTKAYLQK